MKRLMSAGLILAMSLTTAVAQNGDDYVFTPVKELKITSVKNQNRTGTCWSFSGIAHLESELLRMGKGEYDLSEMFIVSHSYKDQAEKYIRTNGVLNFSQGGSFEDVLYAVKHYGIVPESVLPGLNYGEDMHVHNEMESAASAYIKAIAKNPNGKLSTAWKKGFNGIIDAYLGAIPEKFTYKGKEYTPQSFAKELGLDMDNYVSLTSYTHYPFYTPFALEVPDNWRWGLSYNVPINELMDIMKNAINTGYTVAWASDVSEIGFTRNGVAVVPDVKAIESSGSDQERWTGMSQREKNEEIRKLVEKPCQEMTITQEMRQEAYDNFQTTDDHGMQIYGIAKDQNGKNFFMIKNSWGTDNKYNGTWYISEAFMAYKTMSIVVHKDAIPSSIKSKLKL
ncbi:aminopeptidase C [Parabacteroides sp. PF5-5]|uniref:aminopeptidase C n=2 Tax=Parabacteroides TaxID=375288 RepID=UPI00247EDD6A|nr:aminopeptidase C [Parabacteroides sp. PH5-39]MDH6315027.1 aminopeptidase C [Parabacteroides sp. PF5-13]MDH6318687.1 aminopeptidase C [Parabacteroides sp. PH5-13]MDH6322417.1 aminopeptidase C [Parabacteroides sp. PH5-8]MDH6326448.1 aminopeptidase C [Parabacteroides sp. PH5-41]MDH6334248.1 aminopeptidase C [Parabacteroides sp. PF5-5]MDH6345082.1 aminopeptidase C [Parabacteroides sp. PH5-46]MDH6360269.1 aminopeptidase C [Parabacteroides sp. PH5-16]MDH6375705.1 aminopeptidase C [Parabacteroi